MTLVLVRLGLVASATALGLRGGAPPSTLYYNASAVRTMDPDLVAAEAFCVAGGRVTAVGTLAAAQKECGASAAKVDLKGAAVIPGLIDSHAHLLYMGFKLSRPQLENCTSIAEPTNSVISVLTDFLKTHPMKPGQWLQGFGWDQNRWADKAFPTKEQLDTLLPDNPCFLTRVDGHAGWANSAALRAVPPLPGTDPAGGKIVRDPTTGEPTGVLQDNAMQLVEGHIPKPTQAETDGALRLVLDECARNGLTAIHNPGE